MKKAKIHLEKDEEEEEEEIDYFVSFYFIHGIFAAKRMKSRM